MSDNEKRLRDLLQVIQKCPVHVFDNNDGKYYPFCSGCGEKIVIKGESHE